MIFKERTIQETNRAADIVDRFGHTRFCIGLRLMDEFERKNTDVNAKFEVRVISIDGFNGNRTLVDKFFRYYDEAVDFFQKTLKQYELLVKAECRDEKDIHIYAERIGYRKIAPDCCANCRWSQPKCKENSVFSDWKNVGCGNKYVCMNADIFKIRHDHLDIPAVKPEVDGDGICDHHMRILDPKFKNPSHSQWAFEHHDCLSENQRETIMHNETCDQPNRDNVIHQNIIGGGNSDIGQDIPDIDIPCNININDRPMSEIQQFGA